MTQLHIWRNIRFELPNDWELLRFSRREKRGRLSFADRHRFRFELSWRQVPGEPDHDRMMSDYLVKLQSEGELTWSRRARAAGWAGISGGGPKGNNTRFGRYFGQEGALVEVVFLWSERREKALENQVLKSVGIEPEWQGKLRRWRAFGMDLLASKLTLSEGKIEPAAASLTFSNDKRGPRDEFKRLGMAPLWLEGSVGEWLERQAPSGVCGMARRQIELAGHKLEVLSGHRISWPARKRHYRAAAWLCPADGRLYFMSSLGKQGGAGQRLSCCSSMGLE